MKRIRCAVYTRKSTEDGLEQEFNSLDAQREACEAYILSQRHEGWELVPGRYDDGGFSGGTMERPGLRALLETIGAGQVDVIVVYKVDRLTRSLADFAKIVERLDAKGASFVSVTQAFNTTTSMGRLTLNVLLSFAQFEREVTGERIRDKIAASKKKGLWMGGPVPLGYQVVDRKLLAVPAEAEQVRHIMRRYVAAPSADVLLDQLEREGVRTKVQVRTSGPHRGGIPFGRGSLFHLLKNPVYRGMIVHKGAAYPGEHEAIVDQELWDSVQVRLAEKAPPRRRATNDRQDALLGALLSDRQGRPMVATFTCKGTRRYRYYETRRDLAGNGTPAAARCAMRQLDKHIIDELRQLLGDEHALRRLTGALDAAALSTVLQRARAADERLAREHDPSAVLSSLLEMLKLGDDHLMLLLRRSAFDMEGDDGALAWKVALPAKKPFREAKLRLDGASFDAPIDKPAIRLLRDAMEVRELVLASPTVPLHAIAKREGRCRKQMAKLLRVSWLSPRVVEAIVAGRQASGINRGRLLEIDLPLGWQQQEELLGVRTRPGH